MAETKERWRDVPVGGVRMWCGVPFQRTHAELRDFEGRPHVRVIYLEGSLPDEEGVRLFRPGDKGLMSADEYAEPADAWLAAGQDSVEVGR